MFWLIALAVLAFVVYPVGILVLLFRIHGEPLRNLPAFTLWLITNKRKGI